MLNLNVGSPYGLTCKFVEEMKSRSRCRIINISSLCAVQPFPSWGPYCTAKAARDMFHKVLAEASKCAGYDVKTLNYAPGPMDTHMMKQIFENTNCDPKIKA